MFGSKAAELAALVTKKLNGRAEAEERKREKEMELPSLPGCGQFIMSQTEIAKVVFSGELDRYRVARQTL